jgi:putative ABC transport system permease protein
MPNNRYITTIQNKDNLNQQLMSDAYFVDDDFLKQYEIKVVAGRGFSKQYSTDKTQAMLINEAMAKALGYKSASEAIGKPYKQGRGTDHGNIIGVVKDFHFHSFAEAIQPLTLRWGEGYYTCNTINIASGHIQRTINQIEGKYKELAPGLPFIYYFADEAYDRQYVAQQRFGRLFVCFSVLAILISCLGLLGLSAFSTAQRKKEIGVRKVLGASAASITALLSKDFARLVIISLLFASPAAWWLMQVWLQNFAYHIQISVWVFITSGTAALTIALLTVSVQSVKAAMTNPVKNLRAE